MSFKNIVPLLLFFTPQYVLCQTDIFERMDSVFEARVNTFNDNFDNRVRQMDLDFASYLSKDWEIFHSSDVETKDFNDKSNFVNISLSESPRIPSYPSIEGARYGTKSLIFFEKKIEVDVDINTKFTLLSISENQVSKAWRKLSNTSYSSILKQLDNARTQLQLNDWGVFLFVSQIADQTFEKDETNKKNIFIAFILAHAGYNVKLGRIGKNVNRSAQLYLLVPFSTQVKGRKTEIKGKRFYILSDVKNSNLTTRSLNTEQLYSYQENLKSAKSDIDLSIKNIPQIGSRILQKRIESKSQYFREIKMRWKSGLVDYYNTYPTTILSVYLNTPLSVETKNTLLESFALPLKMMDKDKFINLLHYWFIHAFDYKLDDIERPLFTEQTISSTYSDCEDRAILFARILKEIAGLDVVLIVYKGDQNKISHVATGVRLEKKTNDNFKEYKGKRYTIYDPSDTEGTNGKIVNRYRNSEYEIIELIN